jgi:DNA-directed RNA polymerase specialized sigma24 family protein
VEWARRACAGDPRAFRALYEIAFRIAWAHAVRSAADVGRAEPLTARTLADFFSSLANFDGSTSLGVSVLRAAQRASREAGAAPGRPAAGSGAP